MKDKLSKEQIETVLQALDDAIEKGPWDESNFLRVIGKNLREIRDNFAEEAGSAVSPEKTKTAPHLANRVALRSGQQEVFVALYSSQGGRLQSWERIIANLPKYIVSRPVYTDEEDVQNLIKSKENKINEAYVVVYINQSDIIQLAPDKIPVDKLGKTLISLKDKAINLDNIARFVHQSGIYSYSQGRLIKKNQSEI